MNQPRISRGGGGRGREGAKMFQSFDLCDLSDAFTAEYPATYLRLIRIATIIYLVLQSTDICK